MMRPIAIVLLVMGGGALISGLVLHQRNRDCQAARAAGLPNAEQICARSTARSSGTSGSYGSGWHGSRSLFGSAATGAVAGAAAGSAASRPSTGTVSRGGFGRSGGSFSAGS